MYYIKHHFQVQLHVWGMYASEEKPNLDMSIFIAQYTLEI